MRKECLIRHGCRARYIVRKKSTLSRGMLIPWTCTVYYGFTWNQLLCCSCNMERYKLLGVSIVSLIFLYFRDKPIRTPENFGCPRRRTCWQPKGKSCRSQSPGWKDKRLGKKPHLLQPTAWSILHIHRLQENTGWGEAKCIQGPAQRYGAH